MLHNVIYMQNLRIDSEYWHEHPTAKKRNLVPTPNHPNKLIALICSLTHSTDSNGLVVFICKHAWTHSNVFERIQTHSNRLTILVCMAKSHWAPAGAGPRRKLPSRGKSVGNRFTSPCSYQLTHGRIRTGQNTSFQSAQNINIKINKKWNTKENSY